MNVKVWSFALLLVAIAACGGGHKSTAVPPLGNQAGPYGSGLTGGKRTPRAVQDYVSAVMADSPRVYYRLNETSGTTAVDSSGNGYNGTYGANVSHGGPAVVVGDTTAVFPGGTASSATVDDVAEQVADGGRRDGVQHRGVGQRPGGGQRNAGDLPAVVPIGSCPECFLYRAQRRLEPVLHRADQCQRHGACRVCDRDARGAQSRRDDLGHEHADRLCQRRRHERRTGTGPDGQVSSPYAGFTIGGPVDAHTGLQSSAGEFAMYQTALSAARVSARSMRAQLPFRHRHRTLPP